MKHDSVTALGSYLRYGTRRGVVRGIWLRDGRATITWWDGVTTEAEAVEDALSVLVAVFGTLPGSY